MSTGERIQSNYERLRPLLERAWSHHRQRGRPPQQFIVWARCRLGPMIRPYLLQFYRDKLASLETGPEQRQAMIAERAYLLAEQAGFVGDDAGFWRQAEREVAQRLAALPPVDDDNDSGEGDDRD